jgi:tetratricopeptide (TPR) repeat protein
MNMASKGELKKIKLEAVEATQSKDWNRAANSWRRFREVNHRLALGYEQGLMALSHLDRWDEMEELAQEARMHFPENSNIAYYWGETAIARRDWSEARIRWEKIRQQFGNSPKAFEQEGLALLNLERMEETEALLQKAVKEFPNNSMLATNLAQLFVQQQNWTMALACWRDMRERFGDTLQAYNQESIALIQLGKMQEAEEFLTEGVRRWTKDKALAIRHAEVATLLEDWSKAASRWESVCQQFPGVTQAYHQGSLAYANLERWSEAESLLQKGARVFPNNSSFATRLQEVERQRKEKEELNQWLNFYDEVRAKQESNTSTNHDKNPGHSVTTDKNLKPTEPNSQGQSVILENPTISMRLLRFFAHFFNTKTK